MPRNGNRRAIGLRYAARVTGSLSVSLFCETRTRVRCCNRLFETLQGECVFLFYYFEDVTLSLALASSRSFAFFEGCPSAAPAKNSSRVMPSRYQRDARTVLIARPTAR